MQRSIYGFIFKHSLPQQIVLVVLTFAALPFIYLQAELPKEIVNDAIAADSADFPVSLYGFELDQITYLFFLCGTFLALVLVNGGFKYVLNVARGRLGERMLRRLRYELYCRVLRFPIPHFRRVSQGELIPMITQEVEPLGGFIGDAIARPLYQGGILITLLIFIMMQDPVLGVAAIALFPVQGVLIPILQKRVNALAKERVQNVRRLSDHLGESIAGITEIHANDSGHYQRARFAQRLGIIYEIRYKIFIRKFLIKFINNFLAQFTPFLFYAAGGYLAIQGELSVGALIAVISAHKDMNAPWKELLAFYQQREDARIKYEVVIEQFDPRGLLDENLQSQQDVEPFPAGTKVTFRGVTLSDEDGTVYLHHTNIAFGLSETVAITGPSGGGKEEFAPLLARLYVPTGGRINVGDDDLATMPEAKIGRRFGYVGGQPYLFAGTVRDNLLLAIQHAPAPGADDDSRAWIAEAEKSGNSVDSPDTDWINYKSLEIEKPEQLSEIIRDVLKAVMLADDIYEFGLRGRFNPDTGALPVEKFLDARAALRERLTSDKLAGLVEPFDPEKYNRNATVAENLLFGTPVGEAFDMDHLGDHPYVRQILDESGLTDEFFEIGQQVAEIMLDLFADVDTSNELMEQFSFISPEDLPEFQAIMSRINRTDNGTAEADRNRLISLPFRLAPERHRLGLIGDDIQERLLAARKLFAEKLPEDLKDAVAFFDPERFNPASSLQDNLLFGKIAYGRPQAEQQVRAALSQVLHDFDLIQATVDIGLQFQVGVGGSRLSTVQRQKLAIARALLKRPDLLILNNPFGPFDEGLRVALLEKIMECQNGRGVVAVMDQLSLPERFDHVFVAKDGRLTEPDDATSPAAKAAE